MINLRALSIAVAVALGMLGAIQLAAPESLGISAVAARWLGIVGTGLGVLATFLPRVQGPTMDPETLADRVWNLPEADREMIAKDLSDRAERQLMTERLFSPDSQRATPPPLPQRIPGLSDIYRDTGHG